MSKRLREIMFAILLGAVVPAVIFAFFAQKDFPNQTNSQETETLNLNTTNQSDEQLGSINPDAEAAVIPILFDDGSIIELPLENYLVSVVLDEMPSDFEIEAIKAQAVASRTFTLHKMTQFKHEDAAVCTDANCCQGYYSKESFFAAGGTEEAFKKIEKAVNATANLVLTYDGGLIEATYFSCSGGRTEDAAAVWGTDVPYLQSTESPGEEKATHYMDTVTFNASEFAALLDATLTGPSAAWLENVTYTDGGGVDTMTICGKSYTGTELRRYLNLRSTAFALTAIGDTITITTKGFGHRVGMSQYGADAMAVAGSDFAEILAHYYKDTELVDCRLID